MTNRRAAAPNGGEVPNDDAEPSNPGIRTDDARAIELAGARFLLLGGLLAVVCASFLLVLRSLGFSQPGLDGLLSSNDVRALNSSLDWTIRLVTIAIPLQAVWAWTATSAAARARVTGVKPRIAAAGARMSVGFALVGLVTEPQTWSQGIVVIVSAMLAALAVLSLAPIARWLGRSRVLIWLWVCVGLAMSVTGVALSTFRPIDAQSSAGWLGFFGLVLIQVALLAIVLSGAFAIECEDELGEVFGWPQTQPPSVDSH